MGTEAGVALIIGHMEKLEMEVGRKLETETGNGNRKWKLEMETGNVCAHCDAAAKYIDLAGGPAIV